ncbi:hypothetical protein [Streptomyces sp. NPDC051561]|uniref:hypothetical protein n=1 Tax=Streptomyces sp. NPDC051561 TaxID=3365658 RepID=UPI0037AD0B26
MAKRSRARTPTYRSPASWPTSRRVLAGALALLVLLALATGLAWLTSRGEADQTTTPARTSPSSPPAPSAPKPANTGSVPAPPQISDPLAYAKAAAQMLWSYDSRSTTRDQHLAGMAQWMTRDTKYSDWPSLAAQIPDPVLWTRMRDNAQYATAHAAEAHFPSVFKTALAKDPAALTTSSVYAVTVTGKQQLAWKDGGGGAEPRSITLAIQCRPSHDCALVAVSPHVAP